MTATRCKHCFVEIDKLAFDVYVLKIYFLHFPLETQVFVFFFRSFRSEFHERYVIFLGLIAMSNNFSKRNDQDAFNRMILTADLKSDFVKQSAHQIHSSTCPLFIELFGMWNCNSANWSKQKSHVLEEKLADNSTNP